MNGHSVTSLVAAESVAASVPEAEACPGCGQALESHFCPLCGEQRLSDRDYSLRHFVVHAFQVATSLDSKLARSFRTLIARPGVLTAEFMRGRRRTFASPLQIFLIVNVVFFFVLSFTGFRPLSVTLQAHIQQHPWGDLARSVAAGEIRASGLTEAEFTRRFNDLTDTLARSLVIVLAPLFSVVVGLVHRRGHYYLEHVVFALHAFAAFLLFDCVILPIAVTVVSVLQALGRPPGSGSIDAASSITQLLLFAVYTGIASRVVYGGSKRMAIMRGAILTLSVVPVIFAYRFFLFFATIVLL